MARKKDKELILKTWIQKYWKKYRNTRDKSKQQCRVHMSHQATQWNVCVVGLAVVATENGSTMWWILNSWPIAAFPAPENLIRCPAEEQPSEESPDTGAPETSVGVTYLWAQTCTFLTCTSTWEQRHRLIWEQLMQHQSINKGINQWQPITHIFQLVCGSVQAKPQKWWITTTVNIITNN